jgi:hypothetical protein
MDFYQIKERSTKNGVIEIYPDFKVCRSKDLMVRGRSFYAIWDEEKGIWSTDEYDVQRLVDEDIRKHKEKILKKSDDEIRTKFMGNFSSGSWTSFRKYMQNISDNAHQLDEKLTFTNTKVKKTDYVSRKLNYNLEEGSFEAYDEIIGTLYDSGERAKIEWSMGAILSGDAKSIQKFIVLYGEAGAGKSTILNIIQKTFEGYYTTFEAKALTSSNNAFATEIFKSNPLVAIQHDGDLSKIEDNTKLNSIISHEEMTMNEKYKPSYMARVNCFLFMATNKPVKITDAKSGIIRRLIDVRPSGRRIPPRRYHTLMSQIDFELGAIAHHCLQVYQEMGKNYYSSYRPLEMMLQTDVFFNFVEGNYHVFRDQDGISLTQAYEMYKVYCDEALVDFKLPRHKFREELKNYFRIFLDMTRVEGKQVRSYYEGFITDKFTKIKRVTEEAPNSLVLEDVESMLDSLCKDYPAQYASEEERPSMKWSDVKTTLSNITTTRLHYIKPPLNHIVIDFDIREDGKKSLSKNLEAASKWPATYAELSKSGSGVHLHYFYEGDTHQLSRVYDDEIEIKIFVGKSALRRKLTRCNNIPIRTINSGLPLREKKMINFDSVKNEKALRTLIKKNLNKEIHPNTRPSIDFIFKILDEAYRSGMSYDVSDLRSKILAFANNSTNQAMYCIKQVGKMQFQSENISSSIETYERDELVFFDVEVFPNLFVVVWKFEGKDPVKMINPSPADMEMLFKFKLVGFNCRRYDNHILYARYIGYDNQKLFEVSQKIINGSANAFFGEAYSISYTDVYDFAAASNKKGLKKFEIQLGIHHQELGLKWNEPVPEEIWPMVADYCVNDVMATEVVFHHLSGDWAARQILAELSGLTVNDTTNQHSTRIVFGTDKNPQSKLVYTDLSQMFPGYKFEKGVSSYRGVVVGEGGRVYAEPGMYMNVAVLDVASMHPTSIEVLNLLGPYSKRYSDLKKARVAIKRKNIELLKTLLDGRLVPFIEDAMSDNPRFTLKDVSNGLKTALNSAYGLTSAKFTNPFKDPRNIDNIVAKRGALFMVDLQIAVQEKGFKVVHIKTDSIKVPHATEEIIQFIMEFGLKYGYEFEYEENYERFCLVNDAVYIAKTKDGKWTPTGTQFAQPYVFKTLFSGGPVTFEDLCETKAVSTLLYLDMNEGLGVDEHDYHFVGKVGSFCPIKPGRGGGILLREKEGKYYAATGSKGYRWLEAEMVRSLGKQDDIDKTYFDALVDAAIKNISKFGNFENFVSDQLNECLCFDCVYCPYWILTNDGPNKCKLGFEALPF